jgi:hypothetical protein
MSETVSRALSRPLATVYKLSDDTVWTTRAGSDVSGRQDPR